MRLFMYIKKATSHLSGMRSPAHAQFRNAACFRRVGAAAFAACPRANLGVYTPHKDLKGQ